MGDSPKRPETAAGDDSEAGRGKAAPALLAEEEEAIGLGDVRWVDSAALAIFWVLAFVVFLQFFTRYVLNDSLGWTEEIARYLLIGVTFVGAIIAVRKDTHIRVEFFYRYLSARGRLWLDRLVDVSRVAFFAYMTVLAAQLADRTYQKMASIEVSKAVIYWAVAGAFAVMTVYAVAVAWRHFRPGARHEDEHGQLKGID